MNSPTDKEAAELTLPGSTVPAGSTAPGEDLDPVSRGHLGEFEIIGKLGEGAFSQAVSRVGARLAEALAFAHARGVLHCDIKPANILVTMYGRPMLADFNVAFDRTRRAESESGIGGTLPYMAPEHRSAAEGVPGAC